MIKITSDGTAQGTRVTGPDGVALKGISKIEIMPLLPGQMVRAAITFDLVHLEIEAVRLAAGGYIAPPPHPAEAIGFYAWIRDRTDAAHVAYMARHAAGGIVYPATLPMSINASEYMRRANIRKYTLEEVCKHFAVPAPVGSHADRDMVISAGQAEAIRQLSRPQ